MKLVVLVIDIDEEPDYLTAVQEAAFNFGCYIIVVSKSMPCEEMVRELNQVGAAKIIQLPHEKAALAAEFLGFNTEFWTS